MKVSKAISSALLATAALSGASAAFAITDPGTAPTDLLIAVWNTSTNVSYVADLGTAQSNLTSTSSFENPNGFTTSWTIDGGNLGTDIGTSSLLFQVFAADYSCGSCGTFSGNTEYLSLAGSGAVQPSQISNSSLINNYETNVASYINTFVSGSATSYKSTGTQDYWGNSLGASGGQFTISGWQGGAAPGSTLELVQLVGGSPDAGSSNAIESLIGNSTGAGLFSLNGSTLTYTVAGGTSTVPLPAAGWLLVSGLLGLGAVGRRRNGVVEPVSAA